jgi:hypothetical protein
MSAHLARVAVLSASMNGVNAAQVEALRVLLANSGWVERTRWFARALRCRSRTAHGLLVVGTPAYEPWHLTAHLADESALAGLPELTPTLLRWAPPRDAPAHLRVGVDRIERAGRAETLLVVGSEPAPDPLLDRIADARKAGAAILAINRGDADLDSLAHESLAIRAELDPLSFDGAQHLVTAAVGDPANGSGQLTRPRMRGGLARLLDAVSGTPDG